MVMIIVIISIIVIIIIMIIIIIISSSSITIEVISVLCQARRHLRQSLRLRAGARVVAAAPGRLGLQDRLQGVLAGSR